VLRLVALLSSLAVALCLAGASGFLAARALGDAAIQSLILLAAIAVLFGALDAFHAGALVGLEAMRASAMSMLLGAGLGMPATLLLASQFGDFGAVAGLVTTYAVQAGASGLLLRRECARRTIRISAEGGRPELRELFAFTAPSMLSGLMVAPTHWFVQASLMRSAPDGLQLTVLAVAMQWFHAICFVPQVAGRVILPVLSDMRARGQGSTAIGILRLVVVGYAVVVVPVALGIVLASSELMELYGEAFATEGSALAVIAIAAAFSSLCVPVGQAIAAEGRMWLSLAANLLWATVFLVGATMALDTGAYGVGLALLVAYVIQFFVAMGIVRITLRAH
jgi:O-antigen/teichoic acid export membrane protein